MFGTMQGSRLQPLVELFINKYTHTKMPGNAIAFHRLPHRLARGTPSTRARCNSQIIHAWEQTS